MMHGQTCFEMWNNNPEKHVDILGQGRIKQISLIVTQELYAPHACLPRRHDLRLFLPLGCSNYQEEYICHNP